MKMQQYLQAIGVDNSAFANQVSRESGLTISTRLISSIHRKEPIALPKAQAIAQFLTKEMGRPISINDIDDLSVV